MAVMHDPHALPGTDVVVDGLRHYVVKHGRDAHPDEPPLLLIHGLGTSGRLWCDVARDLEHTHRSLIPDLPGCGRSERPRKAQLSPAAQAESLLALLTALGHDRAVVAGHDIGGAVAVHMAALAPERIAALVLVNTPLHLDAWPPAAVRPLLVPGLGNAISRAASLRRDTTAAAVSALAGGPVSVSDGLRGMTDIVRAFDAGAAAAALGVIASAPPPTLVLWGADNERLTPSYGARIAAEIPGATWVPVVGAGHLLPQERPERVAEEVAGFLAEVPALAAPTAVI
jgi:pimeloyl-ACP methyl ester carboxylesterase